MNPFIIKGYEGKRYFCNRESETDRILKAIENKRDLTLVSLRKMGKTGLIMHVFESLRKTESFDTIYLDIYHTENLNELVDKLATELFRLKRTFGQRMKDFFTAFRFIRPVISMDSLTGLPSVSFTLPGEKEAIHTLEDLFAIIGERCKKVPVLVAIDEFQQIAQYPEKNVEALLRGIMQSLPGVRFIFSGSNKNMLSRMFGEASRPFYQSTEMMYLEPIETEGYSGFIKSHFIRNSREVETPALSQLLDFTRRHTWYTQYVCNRLFELNRPVNHETFTLVRSSILLENEPFFFEIRNLITRFQWQLLKAIAHSDGAVSVTSGDFIRRFNLTNASTVRRGIDSLLEKELIYVSSEKYYIYDLFFSRWLETQKI